MPIESSLKLLCVLSAGALLVLPGLGAVQAAAQEVPQYTITGTVVDAQTAAPLPGAVVVLEPAAAGALPTREAGGPAFVAASRSVLTDREGLYRFERLPLGVYRLRVSHVGYRVAGIEVELRHTAHARVSVGLEVEPITLQPVEIPLPAAQPFGRAEAARLASDSSRLAAWRLRERRHLATDTREITRADVLEAVTLAETDLFRALQRLPGVSTRDDYTAELWVRGASWDQTRVSFDGLPLFNPVHGFGLFSGIATEGIGAAFLHSGVRPAALGEGAAGVLDIHSRRGTGAGRPRGSGELSLISGRLGIEWESEDGRRAVMLSGRRTYLDWASQAVERLFGRGEPLRIPYHFSDQVLRVDQAIGRHSTLEFSTLFSIDRISGDVPDVLHGSRAEWGGGMTRATLITPLWGGTFRQSLGLSFGSTTNTVVPVSPRIDSLYSAPSTLPLSSQMIYGLVAGEWSAAPAAGTGVAPWSAGYELVAQDGQYRGPAVLVYADRSTIDPAFGGSGTQLHAALWTERRWVPMERLDVRAGLRVEAGEPLPNAGALRPGPRLAVRYQARPELAFSAGAMRSYQYSQSYGATGPEILPLFTPGRRWLVANPTTPAIRADLLTAGAEGWLGGWLGTANLYLRRAGGIAVPDPTPGALIDRPAFVTADNDARGLELSARRLAGRWTASAGYAFSVSELEAAGLRYPAPADRRHTLSGTSLLRVTDGLRLGAAASLASGAPFTRFFLGSHECSYSSFPGGIVLPRDPECTWNRAPRVEEPNAERGPSYASVDLLLDWNRRFGRMDFGMFLQLRNVMNRKNSAAYYHSDPEYCEHSCGTVGDHRWGWEQRDLFLPGLPILPLFGFRVGF